MHMGTERWGRAPNRKAIPLREEGTLHTNKFYSKSIVLQKPRKAEKSISGEYLLQRLGSFGTEEILPNKSSTKFRHALNQTSSR